MDVTGLFVQLLNGLAAASSLFLVAAGLSLIFGVTRIVNFAHGSFFMVGIYLAYTLVTKFGQATGFWTALLLAAILVGILGACIEMTLLRRLYRSPELFQLLATFAVVLIIQDAVLWVWGPEELLGPRAPGLKGAVEIFGRQFPTYDVFLIIVGPVLLGLLWLLLTRTRWGVLIRAATQDRDMVAALGVNQAWLFTSVFALGALLAGLGGALALPREPASMELALQVIGAAFVVVVVGGMGSLPGAYVAALLISELKSLCIWLGTVEIAGTAIAFSKLTLVVEFLVMAAVLILRPWGLMGRAQAVVRETYVAEQPLRPTSRRAQYLCMLSAALLITLPWWGASSPYLMVLGVEILIAILFATSLYFMMGPGGLHSFGHAAYFGLGAYGAALLFRSLGLPMHWALVAGPCLAMVGAILFGWFSVRLSGVYLAMLTLAFAQIMWAIVFQWDGLTGGSNGVNGIWPPPWLADRSNFYLLTVMLVLAGLLLLRRMLQAPFGYALRATRDSPLRAEALGMDVKRVQWVAFIISGTVAGLAGALYAFSKGSISPEIMHVSHSVDALVMVMLGGIQSMAGPITGAATFVWLHDVVARNTEYWRAVLGGIILLLVLLFPQGISGCVQGITRRAHA